MTKRTAIFLLTVAMLCAGVAWADEPAVLRPAPLSVQSGGHSATYAVQAPEPVHLGGVWVGTWWMGKYEEPVELELVQRGGVVTGRIAMVGYPGLSRDEHASESALIQDGSVEDDRLVLMWLMGRRRFTATLTLTSRDTLAGLGSEDGHVTTGLGLTRVR